LGQTSNVTTVLDGELIREKLYLQTNQNPYTATVHSNWWKTAKTSKGNVVYISAILTTDDRHQRMLSARVRGCQEHRFRRPQGTRSRDEQRKSSSTSPA